MSQNNASSLPATTQNNLPDQAVPNQTPTAKMEAELVTLAIDVFDQIRAEETYQAAIRQQIIANLPNMDNKELIGLITSAMTNKNDLISKTISPLATLMTAAQQNEIAERKERQKEQEQKPQTTTNIAQLNAIAPMEVLQGFQALFNMSQASQLKSVEPLKAEANDQNI